MKLVSPDVIHKTDAGVVLLDVEGSAGVGEAWDTIMIEASGTTLLKGVEWPQMKTPCIPPPTPAAQASSTP